MCCVQGDRWGHRGACVCRGRQSFCVSHALSSRVHCFPSLPPPLHTRTNTPDQVVLGNPEDVQLTWMSVPDAPSQTHLRRSSPFRLQHCVSSLCLEVVIPGEGEAGLGSGASLPGPVRPAGTSSILRLSSLGLAPLSDRPGYVWTLTRPGLCSTSGLLWGVVWYCETSPDHMVYSARRGTCHWQRLVAQHTYTRPGLCSSSGILHS